MRIQKNLFVIACLVLVIAMLTGCGKAQQSAEQTDPTGETQGGTAAPTEVAAQPTEPPTEKPADEDVETAPTTPPVQVVMPQYELTYAGTMADIITWEELTEETGLCFYVEVSTGKVPIFNMLLGTAQGNNVHVKKNAAGEEIFITFLMEEVPEGLSEADNKTFCMAQDIVNDIANSLILK